MTQAAQLAAYGSQGTSLGFKNRIINGAMMIDQRNAGASVTPTDASFTLDRWKAYASQTSKFTVQQNAGSVTPPAGFVNYLGVTSSSAYSVGASERFGIVQQIEGLNVADLAWGTASASAVTLSFKVYSSLTGTFGGAITNSAYNRSYPFSYTISSANTWTTVSITIAGDTTGTWLTTNGVGIQVWFSLGAGSSVVGTAGAWAAGGYLGASGQVNVIGTNGATFYITGVQLEKGSTATPFEYRDYGRELQMCQRYYENNYPTGSAVGTVVGDSQSYGLSYRSGTSVAYFGMIMQQRKRATPSFTAWNGVTGASGTWRGSSSVDETVTISGNVVSFSASTSASNSFIRSGFYEANAEL